jgi:hypothetical protein
VTDSPRPGVLGFGCFVIVSYSGSEDTMPEARSSPVHPSTQLTTHCFRPCARQTQSSESSPRTDQLPSLPTHKSHASRPDIVHTSHTRGKVYARFIIRSCKLHTFSLPGVTNTSRRLSHEDGGTVGKGSRQNMIVIVIVMMMINPYTAIVKLAMPHLSSPSGSQQSPRSEKSK